jgi:hypothetical protein
MPEVHVSRQVERLPGDLRAAVTLVQQAAEAAAALDIDTLEVAYDPHRGFPLAVLKASGLSWHPGANPGSASIDVGVDGSDGAPPFRVRWGDTGHEATFFPGADARVQHFDHQEIVP